LAIEVEFRTNVATLQRPLATYDREVPKKLTRQQPLPQAEEMHCQLAGMLGFFAR
jgi:hypothetical protein